MKILYKQVCTYKKVNGKIIDAKCSVNGKKLNKKESLKLARKTYGDF